MDRVSAPTIGLPVHVVDMTSSGGGGGWCWAKVAVVTWLGETLAVGLRVWRSFLWEEGWEENKKRGIENNDPLGPLMEEIILV
jgi:hypothetical protein